MLINVKCYIFTFKNNKHRTRWKTFQKNSWLNMKYVMLLHYYTQIKYHSFKFKS